VPQTLKNVHATGTRSRLCALPFPAGLEPIALLLARCPVPKTRYRAFSFLGSGKGMRGTWVNNLESHLPYEALNSFGAVSLRRAAED